MPLTVSVSYYGDSVTLSKAQLMDWHHVSNEEINEAIEKVIREEFPDDGEASN